MTRLQMIFAGAAAGVAGAIAVSLAFAPPAPTPAAAPASAPVTVAATPVPAVPAPVAPAPARRAVVAPAPAAKPTAMPPGSAGMVVAIDPETGELGMPSAEQMAALGLSEDEIVSRDVAGTVVRKADGSLMLDLQGRGQDFAVVHRDASGRLVIGCTDHPEDVDHLPATPTGLEEK